MDSGRYIPPQARWENNSALASFGAARESDYRLGGSFGGRGFQEVNYPGDSGYPRDQYRREREGFAGHPPVMGLMPPARRGIVEDDFAIIRGGPRHEKVGYGDALRDAERYRDLDSLGEVDNFRDYNRYHSDSYQDTNGFRDGSLQRRGGFPDRYEANNQEHIRMSRDGSIKDGNRELDYEYMDGSEYERRRHRDGGWEKHRGKPMDRGMDRGRYRGRSRSFSRSISRSRSHSHSRSRSRSRSRSFSRSHSYDGGRERSLSPRRSHSLESRSPRRLHSSRRSSSPRRSRSPQSHSRGRRDDSGDDGYHESGWRRDRDDRRYHDRSRVAPSATLVVKGLSQSTVEDDLYKALQTEWGPLRHVRVIKERNSGVSRGFAFIDFPSVDAAKKAMEALREDGLVLDGRRVYFEYSSKPTGGVGAPQAQSTPGAAKHGISAVDWMCTVCGCVNFARRILCFQCNEGRSDDAPAADSSLSSATNGRKGSEPGPTHILVVRGLDEHVNEDMLHTEFSKYAPIKDLRLVRDKFTHVSRGFAFIHFHSVEEAAAALEATNGTPLEKNGQLLRVAFAKSSGPGSSFHASSIAAAAIEAATFAQQYNSSGRTQKNGASTDKANGAPQSGYVWDEASGYYYDAASGFYYDPHRCLFYDGNHGVWYSYDEKSQQYVPYAETTEGAVPQSTNTAIAEKGSTDTAPQKKDEISTVEEGEVNPDAPSEEEKTLSLAEAVQAAALAAQAAAKKEKEKMKEKEKEIRLAMKGSLLASKKKLLTLWKQRQNEAQVATPTTFSVTTTVTAAREQSPYQIAAPSHATTIKKSEAPTSGMTWMAGGNALEERQQTHNALNATVRKVEAAASQSASLEVNTGVTPFKTDASALGSYAPPAGSKRRFTEAPQTVATQPVYRDRAAERRSLYGSSSSTHDDLLVEMEMKDKGAGSRDWGMDMPFPPGVGPKGSVPTTGAALGGPEVQAFEVITAETALDERNVGNRMLRNMGWQEGSGLGKDGTGIVEPVQATSTDVRAGLGSQLQQRKGDPRFETLPGDSYRVVIQKKALARFHEMM